MFSILIPARDTKGGNVDPRLGAVDPARVAPGKTRLLVVDVQNDFLAPGGWFDTIGSDLSYMEAAVERLAAFIPVARAAGVPPIFIQAIYDEVYLSEPMLERHRRLGFPTEHARSGTWGADFYKIAPEPDDLIVTKHRYSAFVGTDLDTLLRSRKVENVIVCGVTSNVCVESTARDAYMRDYHVCLVSDCTATYDPAAHLATLENIKRAFGIVASAEEVTAAWESSRPPARPRGGLRAGSVEP
jgi:ureidoacrylate peracid hydrolase